MTMGIAFLLCVLEENWLHARQSEDRRAMIANVVIIVTAVIQVAVVFIGWSRNALPLTFFQALLGVYAIAATTKLYERSQFHILRARKLRAHLDELYPDSQVEQLLKSAESEHQTRYAVWMNIRLNTIWSGLHITIMLLVHEDGNPSVVYTVSALP